MRAIPYLKDPLNSVQIEAQLAEHQEVSGFVALPLEGVISGDKPSFMTSIQSQLIGNYPLPHASLTYEIVGCDGLDVLIFQVSLLPLKEKRLA